MKRLLVWLALVALTATSQMAIPAIALSAAAAIPTSPDDGDGGHALRAIQVTAPGADSHRADVPSATPAQLSALDAILARPEFQAAEGRSVLDRLLDPIRAWINDRLAWLLRTLFDWLGQGFAAGGASVLLALAVTGVVVVTGAALLVRRLASGTVAGDSALSESGAPGALRAADELARARELARDGDARRALHHHYLAVLLRLDERDHLHLDGALTNRELLPRLRSMPELATPFAELVAHFDRLWYGQPDCTIEEYAGFALLAERVWQAAGIVAPARASRRGDAAPDRTVGLTSGAP